MKKKKKKNRVITRPAIGISIIIGIIVLVLGEITLGLISSAYRYAIDQMWPPKLELSLTKCIIYRTSFDDFPICEMDIVIKNPSDKSLTVELKELRLFQESIACRFAAGQEIIKVGAKDLSVKHVQFRDKVLDLALKVPQDSATAMIELIYEYVATNSRETVTLTDNDVIKCTYWQTPVFDSDSEAVAMGAKVVRIVGPVDFADTLTGEQGRIRLDLKVFTNPNGLSDFDMSQFVARLFAKDPSFGYYLPAFRRRYGGIYLGYLASDANDFEKTLFPCDLFGNIGDYDEHHLLGTTFEQDFSNVTEFVHYAFDPAKGDESFRLYQENCKYFILLVYEEPQGIDSLAERLKAKGYRVGCASGSRFGMFHEALTLLTPVEKQTGLAEEFNTHLDSLNFVIHNDGFFVFFPVVLDLKGTDRIVTDVKQVTGKPHSVALSFDCRPFKSRLIQAPFSTPVLVFLNFSDKTMDMTVESVRVEYR